MWKCKHCSHEFDFNRTTEKANHSRHCNMNPTKKSSYEQLKVGQQANVERKLGRLQNYDVSCECCGNTFSVKEREKQFPKRKKYFCSRSCANSSGGKAKAVKYHQDEVAHYTTVAWRHHDKKCLVCGEENVVAVHHVNENHNDNDPKNLVPLCPTHHQYMHSRYRDLVQSQVDDYIKVKWGT